LVEGVKMYEIDEVQKLPLPSGAGFLIQDGVVEERV
jgi:hypothetical protein